MKNIIIFTVLCLIFGCVSSPAYKDGTNFSLGIYAPYNGNIYGCQVCSYLSGCKVNFSTNFPFEVEREFSMTNSYFGIILTMETSKVKIKSKK